MFISPLSLLGASESLSNLREAINTAVMNYEPHTIADGLGDCVDRLSSADSSDDDAMGSPGETLPEEKSLFDKVLLNSWEQLNADGAFRYNVSSCVTKTLPGLFGFVAQLNEGRALSKRPTEFSCDKVKQPFDEKKFNFKKAAQSEALFEFRPTRTVSSSYVLPHSPSYLFSRSVSLL